MKIINQERVYDGYFKVEKFTLENKDKSDVKECFERGNSVAALVYKPSTDTFLFTEQFRIGPRAIVKEIVAGSMDVNGEVPQETLKREVIEELGYEVKDEPVHIGSFYVSPGGASEMIHVYLVSVENKIAEGGGVEDEDITLVELSREEMMELYHKGLINDMKTFLAIQHLIIQELRLQLLMFPYSTL